MNPLRLTTLPIPFPPDILEPNALEDTSLNIKLDLLLTQIHKLDRQVFTCQLIRLHPPPGFGDWVKNTLPEYGFLADLDTEDVDLVIKQLKCEINNLAERLGLVVALRRYYSSAHTSNIVLSSLADDGTKNI